MQSNRIKSLVILFSLAIVWNIDAQEQTFPVKKMKLQLLGTTDKLVANEDLEIRSIKEAEESELTEIFNDFRRKEQQSYVPDSDPVIQHLRNQEREVVPNHVIEGIGATNVVPPDPSGDAGINHYVQMVNSGAGGYMQVFDKQGKTIGKKTYFNTLWKQFNASGLGDPIVIYDHAANRWLIAEMARKDANQDLNMLLIAISKSEDPFGGWSAYNLETPTFPDYPKFFIWNNGYYVTTNEYVDGQPIYALERDKMLNGAAAQSVMFRIPRVNIGFQIAMGADWDSSIPPPSNLPALIFQIDDNAWNNNSDRINIYKLDLNWNNLNTAKASLLSRIPVAAFNSNICVGWNECIEQSNGRYIAAIDQLLSFRITYRNFGSHESVVACHVVNTSTNTKPVAGIRWYELRKLPSESTFKIYQQGTYSPDDAQRFYPSITIDAKGNIAMAYSILEKGKFPSLRYTGRNADDPLGTMTVKEYEFATGVSNSSTERWGDYSHISVDAVDSTIFWFTGEYTGENGSWKTKIVSFRLQQDPLDLAVNSLLKPVSGTSFSTSDTLEVLIFNQGKNPIADFTIGYQPLNQPVNLETIKDTIYPGEKKPFKFSTSVNLSAYGDYPFKVFVRANGDDYFSNDTLNTVVNNRPKLDGTLLNFGDLGDYTCSFKHIAKLSLKNTGFDTIRTVTFGYSLDNQNVKFQKWNGFLLKDNKIDIDLNVDSIHQGNHILTTFISSINGNKEVRTDNDTLTTDFINDSTLITSSLTIFTNNAPEESSWELFNQKSELVAGGGPYSTSSKIYKHSLCLKNGECYTLNFYDSRGNGIEGGFYFIRNEESAKKIISIINPKFLYSETNYFCPNTCAIKASLVKVEPTTGNNGFISVNINGGAAPITYELNGKVSTKNVFDSLGIGDYTLIVSDDLGCKDTLKFKMGTTDVKQINIDNPIKIRPNPTSANIFIDWENREGANEQVLPVRVYDARGNLVQEEKSFKIGNNYTSQFELSKQPDGFYYLQISTGKSVKLEKILLFRN